LPLVTAAAIDVEAQELMCSESKKCPNPRLP
jgi:hypothetical protein